MKITVYKYRNKQFAVHKQYSEPYGSQYTVYQMPGLREFFDARQLPWPDDGDNEESERTEKRKRGPKKNRRLRTPYGDFWSVIVAAAAFKANSIPLNTNGIYARLSSRPTEWYFIPEITNPAPEQLVYREEERKPLGPTPRPIRTPYGRFDSVEQALALLPSKGCHINRGGIYTNLRINKAGWSWA